ncbi:MAG: hypothetical protein ABJA75_03415 [Bradyrhizobium sp.]
MRLIVVLGAICALTQPASAQTGDCSAIADAAAKLACYNNEPPPAARTPAAAIRPPATARPDAAKSLATKPKTATTMTAKTMTAKTAAATSEGSKYIDKIGEEDAIVSAKMRNICRGC